MVKLYLFLKPMILELPFLTRKTEPKVNEGCSLLDCTMHISTNGQSVSLHVYVLKIKLILDEN